MDWPRPGASSHETRQCLLVVPSNTVVDRALKGILLSFESLASCDSYLQCYTKVDTKTSFTTVSIAQRNVYAVQEVSLVKVDTPELTENRRGSSDTGTSSSVFNACYKGDLFGTGGDYMNG